MSKKLLVTFVLLFVLLFSANLMAADVTEHSADGVTVMSSAENFPSLYLTSDDPANKGRRWVESSLEKENKATGSMKLVKSNGEVIYEGTLTQIKGRGNSTWYAPKKPYQIKLSVKFDLLQTGDKNNKSKTWVLLANYYDIAMMRNRIVFDLAASMQMENPIQYTYVNLYYDGEYRGLYQLSEKVEVDKGRVEIADLEGDNEDANPDVDLEDLPSSMDKTSNGATYVYCQNMKNPENITGGYLLEMDYVARAEEEACYFRTRRNRYIVVKSPEFCSKEQMDYIASLYQELEDAVHFGGVNPFTGKKYSDY
ncbi:MAG: CotH kinase family protein, partial [Firmicutes bacterium]|nr:CotH kinase family protein [Bacillota bacterium]